MLALLQDHITLQYNEFNGLIETLTQYYSAYLMGCSDFIAKTTQVPVLIHELDSKKFVNAKK